MDAALYKSVLTRRGFKYNYYFSPPIAEKPSLLFVHGFPCTSYDWRYQVAFFQDLGYGLIVPDMLGYGGTDKPVNCTDYKTTLMAHDLVDILGAETVGEVIAVGHDWGSIIVSRLANYFPDRFIGFAFFGGGYLPPTSRTFAESYAEITKAAGREVYGYCYFLAEEGAPKLIEKNIDSFYSLMLADDPKLWITDLSPSGACKAWVEGNKKTKYVSCLPENEIEKQKREIFKGGFSGPVNYYKVRVLDLDFESTGISAENLLIHKPVFLATALQDSVSLPWTNRALTTQHAKGPVTIKDFDTGHWLMWEEKDKVNKEMLVWIKGLAV